MPAVPRPLTKADAKILETILAHADTGRPFVAASVRPIRGCTPADVSLMIQRAKRRGWLRSVRTASNSGEGRGGWAWRSTGQSALREMRDAIAKATG